MRASCLWTRRIYPSDSFGQRPFDPQEPILSYLLLYTKYVGPAFGLDCCLGCKLYTAQDLRSLLTTHSWPLTKQQTVPAHALHGTLSSCIAQTFGFGYSHSHASVAFLRWTRSTHLICYAVAQHVRNYPSAQLSQLHEADMCTAALKSFPQVCAWEIGSNYHTLPSLKRAGDKRFPNMKTCSLASPIFSTALSHRVECQQQQESMRAAGKKPKILWSNTSCDAD